MYYSDEIVEEVRSQNDIVDVISEYTGLKRAGSTYKCCCPFHNEKTPSFTVSREKQMYYCFGCHVGGNVYTFLMKHENMTFPEAIEYLAKRAGIELPEKELSDEDKKKQSWRAKLYEVNMDAAGYFHYLLTKTDRGKLGYEYYKNRGFTDETINNFGLGYSDIYRDDLYKYLKSKGHSDELMKAAGLVRFDERDGPGDQFWNRVIVPITDISGKVIGFGGRVLGDAKPKYLNTRETEIFNKGRNLFAMNIARHSKKKGVILCEGYMDVIAMHQAGYTNATASLGTALTEAQAGLIKRYTSDVYLAYDSDGAGVNATMRAIGILRKLDLSQKVIDLRPYKDPDEFIKNEGIDSFDERVRNALNGRLFEIDHIVAKYDLNDPEEKTKFMKDAGRLLAGITDVTERHNYIDTVSSKYFLDKEELGRIVTQVGLAGLAETSLDAAIENDVVDNTDKRELRERQKKKSTPAEDNEKYLLTMMVNEQRLFDKLSGVISEKDFTEEIISDVAKKIFEQYRSQGKVVPANILNSFEDAESQEKVSEIFTKEFEFDTTPSIMEKVLTDVIIKIKTNNIDKALRENSNVSYIQLARQKEEVKKIRIKL
ncbi:MAG: DNA primase [Eubacterium sp.]|nr:DNA primase [Eubacterium sp.]